MTIYELTEDERNVMRKLIENKLVVTIGSHADVKRQLTAEREQRMHLEGVLTRLMNPMSAHSQSNQRKEITMEPKYPQVTVQLTGEDGNAFSIIGRVTKALRRAGAPKEDVDAFSKEAMSGDYNGVLQTAMKYVDVA